MDFQSRPRRVIAGGLCVLAACGAADAATAARHSSRETAFARRADAICAASDHRLQRVKPPAIDPSHLRASQLPQVARYLGLLQPILAHEIAQLRELGTAPAKKPTWRRFVRDIETDLAHLEQRRISAARGHLAAVERSFAADNAADSPGADATRRAHILGLEVCGR